jgi:hypothetical protein
VSAMARRKRAIDREAGEAGLAALSVAIGELMEAEHEAAVTPLRGSHARRLRHVINLRQIGSDIAVLASAAEVLIRRSE